MRGLRRCAGLRRCEGYGDAKGYGDARGFALFREPATVGCGGGAGRADHREEQAVDRRQASNAFVVFGEVRCLVPDV